MTPQRSGPGRRRARDGRRLLEAGLAAGAARAAVGVENRPGVVAEIALALGKAGVNIEDMALYPAADMRTGAISLWVAGDDDAERAAEVVRGLGHTAAAVAAPDDERFGPPAARGDAAPAARQVDLAPRRDPRRDGGGPARSRGYLDSGGTRSTLEAVRALGATVDGCPARPPAAST